MQWRRAKAAICLRTPVAALGRLDDMQGKLAKFKKAGVVESDTVVEYTQRINTMRDALGEINPGMNKAGLSTKQMGIAGDQIR